MTTRTIAVFPSLSKAQDAITELRLMGLKDQHLSVLNQHLDNQAYPVGAYRSGPHLPLKATVIAEAGETVTDRTLTGMVGGAGVGALFGLAAAMIPGVGPFIAAGAMVPALGSVGASVTAGALVGGTSGAIASALNAVGWSQEDSAFYGTELEAGRAVVTVDFDEHQRFTLEAVADALHRHGGLTAPERVGAAG